ncbi:MAG TPA: ATP-binding protein [Anaerolineales bacterium]|nr:ATP-binding protein [Anaerolineales bacterium]
MLPDFRVRQRDDLLEISRLITEELDLQKVLARILRVATQLLASHAGLVALHDEGEGWRLAATHGLNPDFTRELEPLLSDIPAEGDPAVFAVPEVNRRLQRVTRAASMGLLNGVGLPLLARGEVVGVLFVFRSYEGAYSSEDRALLQAFASQAAIAVSNARLYTQVNRQKQFLDVVLESSADGIFLLDPRHRIVRFNRACERLLALPAAEAVGRAHDEVFEWARREPGLTLDEAEADGWPLSAQATLYVEGDLRRRSAGTVSVGVTYAPALGADGRMLSIVGSVRDITKFRQAEELKSTFISIVSHELRTPVALIKGYVGTLRREDATWEPSVVRDSLAVIEDEADHLAGLIDDLLDASRLQAGVLGLNKSEVALDSLAQRVVERFRTQSGQHTFEVRFPKTYPLLQADEQRLTQVFNNLLSNAMKYSPAGGKIRVQGSVRGEEAVVCVSDEGPGIDPQDAPHIFERFYRSASAAQRTQGAGLGLFLAKSVVEAHGGRIWVDPERDRGARICFSLPRS